ncbi:MAG TPA: kelch repeat-containing protein [Polyangiaceae bacterium]|nr:kelch repeat-containing protein [Polyangiaceae bacterium]
MTALSNGQVLVAGGFDDSDTDATSELGSAELYDPEAGTFTAADSMTAARYNLTATLLASGKVFMAGSWDGSNSLASAEHT